MEKQKSPFIIYWILFCVILAVFYVIQFSSPQWISNIHASENFSLLNQLSGSVDNQTLPYYQGTIEDRLFGPLKSFITGFLFLSFALIYLRGASKLQFALTVLIYFVASRPFVLLHPPYGESITGPFMDAIWLVRHSLDYIGLLQQENFTTGGPQIYPTSIYPMFLAILMKITPGSSAFLITIHLIVFFLAGWIIALFRDILQKMWNEDTAIIGATLLLSLPVFQTMSELINMEVPCTFFAILTVYLLIMRRVPAASFAAVCAVLIKAPGAIVCGVLLFGTILLVFSDERPLRKVLFILYGLGACAAAVLKGYIRSQMLGEQTSNNKIGWMLGKTIVRHMIVYKLFLWTLLPLALMVVIWWVRNYRKKHSFRFFISEHTIPFLMFAMAAAWIALYFNFSVMGHRYKMLLSPFIVFCFLYSVISILRTPKIIQPLMILLISGSFLCSHGWCFKEPLENGLYKYNHLERSLEYRNDLRLQMMLAKELENNYTNSTIGSPHITAQALSWPEIGYVDRKLDIMLYGMRATHNIKEFKGLDQIDVSSTIWIGFEDGKIIPEIDYPIDPRDKIVEELVIGNKKIFLFIGGIGIERMRRVVELYQSGKLKNYIAE